MERFLNLLKEIPAWSVLIFIVGWLLAVLVLCYLRGIPVDDFLKGLILSAFSALFLSLNSNKKQNTGNTETGDVIMPTEKTEK